MIPGLVNRLGVVFIILIGGFMEKEEIDIYLAALGEFNNFWDRSRKVYVSKNMCVLFHNLLLSLSFEDGEMVFKPTAERKEILDTFTRLDLIDAYERLPLIPTMFGVGLCDEAKEYVFNKITKVGVYRRRYK